MNHKRKKPRQQRAGCLMCKAHKMSFYVKAARMKAERQWRSDWHV